MFLTLDFETYYADDYSLSKMTTEEYINDPRFEVIGLGIKEDDAPPRWLNPKEVRRYLDSVDWATTAVLCHHAHFDGGILSYRYGCHPAMFYDTLCMARAVNGPDAPASLAALVKHYGLGEKGTEVLDAKNKKFIDFSPEQYYIYGIYCKNDVELTYKLFNKLGEGFPDSEYELIDLTIKMFTNPQLAINDKELNDRKRILSQHKLDLFTALNLNGTPDEIKKQLTSNIKFAEILKAHGIEIPMKRNSTNTRDIPALAKTDEAFIELSNSDDPAIAALCAARLGARSTGEESRIQRFLDIGARCNYWLPIPLKYYGAHTGRWSGMDAINLQNIPSRDAQKRALKRAIRAPHNWVVINADSSQIEARILAWMAGQSNVVAQFAYGEDVYCNDATSVYGRRITKANPMERFVGKTMRLGLGYGTGAEKLRRTLKTTPPGADLGLEQCVELVKLWRRNNGAITKFWRECDDMLVSMISWPKSKGWYWLGGKEGVALVTPMGIKLPNNMFIRYSNLRHDSQYKQILHDSRKGVKAIWGGTVVENVIQALARIVIGEQMIAINKLGYRPALTVHDSLVYVVRSSESDHAIRQINEVMHTAPAWAPGLPVACEIKAGSSYGEA